MSSNRMSRTNCLDTLVAPDGVLVFYLCSYWFSGQLVNNHLVFAFVCNFVAVARRVSILV